MNIYVDGSYCQKTRKGGIGISIAPDGNCVSQHYISESVDVWCSLKAEILAVKRAVEWTIKKKIEGPITIHTDCSIIVQSFKTRHMIKGFQSLCEELYYLLIKYKIKLQWIKRDKNTTADELARQARKL